MDASARQQFEDLLSQYRAESLPTEVSSVLYDFFVFDSNSNETKREVELGNFELRDEVANSSKQGLFELTSKEANSLQQLQEIPVQSITDNLWGIRRNLLECDDLYVSYFHEGCGCSRNCHEKFPREVVLESHLDAIGLDHYCQSHVNHQHVLLLGAMNALVKNQPIETKKKRSKSRINARTFFRFRGEEVCRKFFMYAFGCGEKRMKNLMKQFLTDGVHAKQHKSIYLKNYVKNTSNERRRDALIFIANYAQQNGLQLPGRWVLAETGPSDRDLYLLPGHNRLNRRLIYEQYCMACVEIRSEAISFALWNELWDLKYPNIQTTGSRSEPCCQCRCYKQRLLRSSSSAKLVLTERYLSHLNRVQCELDYYRNCLDRARQVYENQVLKKADLESRLRHNLTHSLSSMHYTIDWFSTISLPYCAQRSPTAYFKSGYKVALFGISIASIRRFILYIIPEFICHQSELNMNLILSLLHHFFEQFCFQEKATVIHFANNSLGQAKNSLLLNYFIWRVLTGHHDKVNVSYLPSGHSHSWNDLFMGVFKKKIQNCQVNSLAEIKTIAERCTLEEFSQEGESHHQPEMIQTILVGNDSEEILIPLYNWKQKLAPVQRLSSEVLIMNHHFEINIVIPGYVLCSETSQNSEIVSYKLVGNEKLTLLDQELPCKYQPEPLSPERRKYLFEFILPFFSKDCQTVKICEIRQVEDDDQKVQPESLPREPTNEKFEKKKQPKCSYCNQLGHRAAIFGKVNCPKKKRDCSILQSMDVLDSKVKLSNPAMELASGIVVEASDDQLDPIIEQLDTNQFASDSFEADYHLLEEVCVKSQIDSREAIL